MKKRPIVVTTHAVEAYARRLNDPRVVLLERHGWSHSLKAYVEIEDEIRECVEIALEDGLIFNHRPPGFVLWGRRRTSLPPGQRFVQCDEDSNYGFILKRTTDEGDIVITTLTRAGVRR